MWKVSVVLVLLVVGVSGRFFRNEVHARKQVDLCDFNIETECIAPGDSCSGDCELQGTNNFFCEFCQYNGVCENSECTTDYTGIDCDDNEDCSGFLTSDPFECVNGICVAYDDYKVNNDPCTSDSECYGPNTCGTNDLCTGVAIGDPCTDTRACAFNAYCNTNSGECEVLETAGSCVEDADCRVGYECNNGTGGCTEYWSLSENDPCGEDDFLCEQGLVCDSTVCVQHFPGGQVCTDDSDCNTVLGSTCECDIFGGDQKCVSNGLNLFPCKEETDAFSDCVDNNNCKFTPITFVDTCISTLCGDEIDNFLSCSTEIAGEQFGDFASCVFPNVQGNDDDSDEDGDAASSLDTLLFF